MTVKPVHQQVAEQLNALMDQVEKGPWDHYEAGRDREAIQAALALKEFAVRFKDQGATAAATFKAAPAGDEFDQLGQQIADAARQMAMQTGGDRKTIIDQLRSYAMQLATPQRAAKAAKISPMEAAVKGYNWDGR